MPFLNNCKYVGFTESHKSVLLFYYIITTTTTIMITVNIIDKKKLGKFIVSLQRQKSNDYVTLFYPDFENSNQFRDPDVITGCFHLSCGAENLLSIWKFCWVRSVIEAPSFFRFCSGGMYLYIRLLRHLQRLSIVICFWNVSQYFNMLRKSLFKNCNVQSYIFFLRYIF